MGIEAATKALSSMMPDNTLGVPLIRLLTDAHATEDRVCKAGLVVSEHCLHCLSVNSSIEQCYADAPEARVEASHASLSTYSMGRRSDRIELAFHISEQFDSRIRPQAVRSPLTFFKFPVADSKHLLSSFPREPFFPACLFFMLKWNLATLPSRLVGSKQPLLWDVCRHIVALELWLGRQRKSGMNGGAKQDTLNPKP